MASEPPADESPAEPKLDWRQVPTVFVDAAIGNVNAGGVHRITLAEFALDPDPGATSAFVRPVVTLAMTPPAIAHLVKYLTELILPPGGEEPNDNAE